MIKIIFQYRWVHTRKLHVWSNQSSYYCSIMSSKRVIPYIIIFAWWWITILSWRHYWSEEQQWLLLSSLQGANETSDNHINVISKEVYGYNLALLRTFVFLNTTVFGGPHHGAVVPCCGFQNILRGFVLCNLEYWQSKRED